MLLFFETIAWIECRAAIDTSKRSQRRLDLDLVAVVRALEPCGHRLAMDREERRCLTSANWVGRHIGVDKLDRPPLVVDDFANRDRSDRDLHRL